MTLRPRWFALFVALHLVLPPAGAPVVLDGKILFFVRERVLSFTPEDRAGAILRKVKLFLKDPGPEILFVGFGDSSLDFHLRVWTIAQVKTPLPLASELYFSIFRAFKENGIEIPFPQRDLHLKTVSTSIRVAHEELGKTDSPRG